MVEERKEFIDIVKGISILAIVLLHYEDGLIPTRLNVFIGMFMITSFYFTSGWIKGQSQRKISVKDLIKQRIPTLIRPYLWFSLILLFFEALLVVLGLKEPILLITDFYKTIVLRGIGTLWFLPALLGGEIIFVFLRDKSSTLVSLALFISLLYSCFFWNYVDSKTDGGYLYKVLEAPLHTLENILSAWIIIAAGYCIGNKFGVILIGLSKVKNALLTIGLIGLSLVLLQNPYSNTISVVCITMLLHIVTPLIILLIAISTEHLSFTRFFQFWGRNSLVLMVTHYTILMELSIILNTFLTGSSYFGGMNAMYFFMGTMLLEYWIVLIVNSKAKFLIGK